MIVPDGVCHGIEHLRRADIVRHVRRIALAKRMVGERPVDVLAQIEVGIAVAVQVCPGGAGAPEVMGWNLALGVGQARQLLVVGGQQLGLDRHLAELAALLWVLGIDRLVMK